MGILTPILFLFDKPNPQFCKVCFTIACVSITTLNSMFLVRYCRRYLESNLNIVDLDDETFERYHNLYKHAGGKSARIIIAIFVISFQVTIPSVKNYICKSLCG